MYQISQVLNQVLNEAQRNKPKNTSLKTSLKTMAAPAPAAAPFTAEDYRKLREMSGSKDVAKTCIIKNIVKRKLAKNIAEEAAAKVLYLKAMREIPYAAMIFWEPSLDVLEDWRFELENGTSTPITWTDLDYGEGYHEMTKWMKSTLGDQCVLAYIATDGSIHGTIAHRAINRRDIQAAFYQGDGFRSGFR